MAAIPRLTAQSAWGWAFISLFAGAPVLALYGINPWGFSPSVALLSVYQVGLAALLLWAVAMRLRPGAVALAWHRDSLLRPLGWLFVWGCLSAFWAHNHYEAGMKLLLWATALFCATLVVAWPAQQRQLRILIAAVFFVGPVLAAYSIAQLAYGIDWPVSENSLTIVFGNNNQASEYLLLSWPLGLLLLACSRPSFGFSLSWWGVIFLYFSYLLLARSLAAQLALIVQLVFVLIFWGRHLPLRLAKDCSPSQRWWLAISALLLLGVVLLSAPELQHMLVRLPEGVLIQLLEKWEFTQDPWVLAPYRLYHWINTLPMIRDHALVGVGIGNWTVFYPDYYGAVWLDSIAAGGRDRLQNAHNDYLEIFAELGLVGMVLVLWVALRIVRVWWSLRRGVPGLLIVGPVGFAVLATSAFPMAVPGSLMLLMLYIALLERSRRPAVDDARVEGGGGSRQLVAICAVALCLLCICVFNYRLYRAERLHLRALSAHDSRIRDFEHSAVAVQALQQWLPWRLRESVLLVAGWRDTERHELLISHLERALVAYPYDTRLLRALSSLHMQAGRHERALDYLLREGRQFQHPRYIEEAGKWHLRGLAREWISPVRIERGEAIHRAGQSTISHFSDSSYYSYHPQAPSNFRVFDWSVAMATTLIALGRHEAALQQLRIAHHSVWMAAEELDFVVNASRHFVMSEELQTYWHQWHRVGALIDLLSAGDASPQDVMATYGSSRSTAAVDSGQGG